MKDNEFSDALTKNVQMQIVTYFTDLILKVKLGTAGGWRHILDDSNRQLGQKFFLVRLTIISF